MYILGINGSPQKDGNTMFLMGKVLDKCAGLGANTEVLYANEIMLSMEHPFCVNCSTPCSGICYKGTKLEEAFVKLKQADGLILASPVYFGTVSAQLKAFFDKTRKLRGEKVLLGKPGVAVTCGASKYGGQETTVRALHDIMLVHGMTIVGDGYDDSDCGHFGVSAQKPANTDEYGIKRADIAAKRLFQMINK